jgi:phenylacetic acid degradation operon negative regulatory protein
VATPPLNPRSLLFTLYGDYVHPLGQHSVAAAALVRAATELGVTGNALRSALSRMTREGWLEPHRPPKQPPSYRLTAKGERLIEEGTARIYGHHRPSWDGQWLLVSYSIPEHRRGERDRLRQGLTFLGFGSLGNGIFVSPHDLRAEATELIHRTGAEHDVTMHHGTLEWPSDPQSVVATAWDLKALAPKYEDFVQRTTTAHAQPPATDAEAFQRRFLLTHEFRRFQFADPDLPDALLPPGWIGATARERFRELNASLKQPAERHWQRIAQIATIVENDERPATATGGG